MEGSLNISTINGYDELKQEYKDLFKKFIKNFYGVWGIEARKTLSPISIKLIEEIDCDYLRFDYILYGHNYWLHVKSAYEWY